MKKLFLTAIAVLILAVPAFANISFTGDKVVVPASNLNSGSVLTFMQSKDGSGNTIYMVVSTLRLPAGEIQQTRNEWAAWVNRGRPPVGTDSSYMVNFYPEQFELNNINLQAPYSGISFSNAYLKIHLSTSSANLYSEAYNDFLVYALESGSYSLIAEGSTFAGPYHMFRKN